MCHKSFKNFIKTSQFLNILREIIYTLIAEGLIINEKRKNIEYIEYIEYIEFIEILNILNLLNILKLYIFNIVIQ